MRIADLWEHVGALASFKLQTRIGRLAFAVLSAATATVLTFGLRQLGPFHLAFILYYPAIVIVAMVAGSWPGILATALAVTAGRYFFLEPTNSFAVRTPEDVIGPVLCASIGVFLTILTHSRGQTQDALSESEDRYRDLVEHSEDLVCTHDLEGRLLSVNPAPARLLGYEVAQLLKIPMRELIAPEFREQFDGYLARISTNGADRGLLCVVARNGERRIWEYSNTLRTEGVVEPIVRGMAHDVTERKRADAARKKAEESLRKSEEHFRILVEQASDGIFLADSQGRYQDVNSAGAEMLGYSREEILQLSIADIIAKEEIPRLAQEVDRFAGGAVAAANGHFAGKMAHIFQARWWADCCPTGDCRVFCAT